MVASFAHSDPFAQPGMRSPHLALARRAFLRRLAASAVVMAGGLSLVACAPRPRAPLRVGTATWLGNEPMHLAAARGLVPREQVHLVRLPTSTTVLQGLITGQLDAATLTLDEWLSARQDQLDLRAVAVLDVSAGADRVLGRPGLASAEALRGRSVAVENSAVGALLLDAFLRHHGLDPQEVRTVFLPADQQLEAWRAGRVDVFVSYDPFALALEAQGAVSLFDSGQIPGRIVDVLVAMHPCDAFCVEGLAALLAGHFRVLEDLLDGSPACMEAIAGNLGVSPEQLRASMTRIELVDRAANHAWIEQEPPRLRAAAAEVAAVMMAAGFLTAAPEPGTLIDARVLARLART